MIRNPVIISCDGPYKLSINCPDIYKYSQRLIIAIIALFLPNVNSQKTSIIEKILNNDSDETNYLYVQEFIKHKILHNIRNNNAIHSETLSELINYLTIIKFTDINSQILEIILDLIDKMKSLTFNQIIKKYFITQTKRYIKIDSHYESLSVNRENLLFFIKDESNNIAVDISKKISVSNVIFLLRSVICKCNLTGKYYVVLQLDNANEKWSKVSTDTFEDIKEINITQFEVAKQISYDMCIAIYMRT